MIGIMPQPEVLGAHMRKRRQALLVIGTLLIMAALLTYWVLPPTPTRLQASAYPALVPQADMPFAEYITESRNRIRNVLRAHYFQPDTNPFRGQYNIDQVTEMRSPFELLPASHCNSEELGTGILMAHGLTDSPYLMRSVANALKFREPCSHIRALLMPGHSTVPGDLLNIHRDDWRDTLDYGVHSFAGQVDEIIVLGYSNGSALALDYLQRNPDQELVSGLLLVSPALQASNEDAHYAPLLKYAWPWLETRSDEDAVKYESFPTNAAGQFYRLTSEVLRNTSAAISTPTLMFLSADDTTVRSDVAAQYFCDWLDHPDSRLFWYTREDDSPLPCARIERQILPGTDPRYVSFSHVALMIPPGDRHYGEDGKYPACAAYVTNAGRYEQCMTGIDDTVYGEMSLLQGDGLLNGKLLRRSTFNPYFDEMITAMACFVDQECRGNSAN